MGRREKQKEETRQHLLETAKRLFEQEGFEKTTIRGIAKAAGVASGTVFVHFPDKLALLATALMEEVDKGVEEGWNTLPEADLLTQLLHLASCLYRNYARQPELSWVLVKESASIGGELGEGLQQREVEFVAGVSRLFEEAVKRGETRVDPTLGATIFFSHYLFALLQGYQTKTLGEPEQLEFLTWLLSPLFFPQVAGV